MSTTYWDYNDNLASRISKPDDCFRLTVDKGLGRNYLDAYTVTLDPQGADVGWGEIAWEAWEDLTCESMDFVAMEQVDVCAMFADEVDACRRLTPSRSCRQAATLASEILGRRHWLASTWTTRALPTRHRFTAMWYERGKECKPPNLYADLAATTFDETDMVVGATEVPTQRTAVVVQAGMPAVWVKTLDKDFDPIYGDLGKADHLGATRRPTLPIPTIPTSAPPMTEARRPRGCSDNNGTLCDANGVEIATSVTFPLGLGYGCDESRRRIHPHLRLECRGNRTTPSVVRATPLNADADIAR